MKHTKRRRRKKISAVPTPVAKEDEEQKVIRALMEVFSSVSLDDATYAYREADGDAGKAAEILERAVAECSEEPFTSSTASGVSGSDAASSSGSSSGLGSSEGFESGCIQNLVSEKGLRGKQKRVVAAAGTVSTVLGKEYVSSIPRRGPTSSEVTKLKGFGNGGAAGQEEAEQFLCSMLGDESELSLAVVRDVLFQCGYDVEKALDALLEASSSYEQSSSSSNYIMFFKEDNRHPFEQSDTIGHLIALRIRLNMSKIIYGIIRRYSLILKLILLVAPKVLQQISLKRCWNLCLTSPRVLNMNQKP